MPGSYEYTAGLNSRGKCACGGDCGCSTGVLLDSEKFRRRERQAAYHTHDTRASDSSFYDEKCVVCGATDADGDERLSAPCPGARMTKKKIKNAPSSEKAASLVDLDRLGTLLEDVSEELQRATSKFGPFHSAHEGYAVILEELDELWDEIKSQNAYSREAQREAIQVAAMALRFVIDVCDKVLETPKRDPRYQG